MFQHTRDPKPEWQTECERIAPRSDRLNWLLIVWEPGEVWKPVQRWVIREMVPRLDTINPIQMQAYHGVHPRELGAWVDGEWVTQSVLSREQFELFQRTGCHSRRVWVVQGDQGGHPRAYTWAEQQAAKARGLPEDPPAIGSLPYAEPDRRTWSRLTELDKLRKWHNTISWESRQETKTAAGLYVWKDTKADYEAWGQKMEAWFSESIRESLDQVSKKDWAMVADLPDPGPEPDVNPEGVERQFLHSSSLGA